MKAQILQNTNSGGINSNRIISLEHAVQYWLNRMNQIGKEPYLHCEFQNQFVAKRALDSLWENIPELIGIYASGLLAYGIYPVLEEKWEVLIAGEMSHEAVRKARLLCFVVGGRLLSDLE